MSELFLELDFYQLSKHHQAACGDSFHSVKVGDRTIAVLADGLGSGIKASVLSTLTTTMAARFISSDMDIKRAAEIILETLPVCSYRHIGYSTFTILDADSEGMVRIIEHDNPPYVLYRGGEIVPIPKQAVELTTSRKTRLFYSEFQLEAEDRIIFYSDGVTQAGMGLPNLPLGWLESGVEAYIRSLLSDSPLLSAGEISKKLVLKAKDYDGAKPADDITCAALYLRRPRRTLLVTGPPYKPEHDRVLADLCREHTGKKIISGGTTAEIIAREMNLPLKVNLREVNSESDIPPTAGMTGFDLVTEGTITLSRVWKTLEADTRLEDIPDNAVKRMIVLLLNSDIIDLVVGTKINEAHQDPALPKDLEIRRNLVKQLCHTLETKYYKQTSILFV